MNPLAFLSLFNAFGGAQQSQQAAGSLGYGYQQQQQQQPQYQQPQQQAMPDYMVLPEIGGALNNGLQNQRQDELNMMPNVDVNGVPMDAPGTSWDSARALNGMSDPTTWTRPTSAGVSQQQQPTPFLSFQTPGMPALANTMGGQQQQQGFAGIYEPNMLLKLSEGYNRGGVLGAIGTAMTDYNKVNEFLRAQQQQQQPYY
jgi:hypothetical protein